MHKEGIPYHLMKKQEGISSIPKKEKENTYAANCVCAASTVMQSTFIVNIFQALLYFVSCDIQRICYPTQVVLLLFSPR